METYQKKFKSDSTLALQTMSVVPDSRKVEEDSAFLDVTVCDPALGRTQIHFELVRKDGKWLVRKEVQTLLPPATDAEKKSMSGALRLMGVKFEDETENRFAGIYKNIDKAPLTVKAIREKNRKALWELLKKEDPDVSYDAVCMLYIPKYLTAEEVKGFQFNDVSRLDRLAAKLRDFYFLNDPGADFPDAWDYEQAEKWGTLSRLIVSQAVLGRFVWGSYQKRKASYLDQIFASWLDNAKITEDSAFLLYAFWSSYPLTPKMGYDRMKEIDILAKNGAPEWLTEYLRGNTAIQMAWDARGSGYASSVSKDGWDKFGDYLKQADRYLDHSIQLNPQNYLAYRDKITTAMGHGTSAQELDNFRKAIAINPDNSTHMSTLLTALLPRWGGSRREMMQLLLEGMKQDETKTEIPLLSYNSICESFFDDEHVPLTYRSVYLDPVVQDCGERLIAYALKQSEDVYYQNLIRYAQALFYLNSVRYREAIEAFEKITFRGYELDKFLYDNSVQVYQLYCPITPIYEDPKEAFALRRSSIAPILQRIELNFVKEEITPAVARRQLLALADSDEAKADPSIRNALINLAAMWGDPDDPATNYKLNANHSGTAWECACISFSSSRMKFFFDHDFDVEAEPHFFLRARYYSGLISTASQLELSSAFQKTINDEARKHWKFIVGESDPKRTIDVESNSPVIDYILADAASPPGIRNLLAIEYSSRQKFIFKLQGDSLTVEPFLYGPLPSVITVNGRPWIDLSKPFRLPFKPDYSHGFSLSLKRASKWNSHAVCDGKDYAELLIVPDVENVDAQMMAVVVDFRTEAERNGESAASADSRTSAPTLNPPAANVDGKATVTIEGNIDGEDAFLFCDGWIVLVHKSNARPNGLTVNGKPWKDPSKPFQLGFTPDPAKTRYVCEGRGVSSMIRSEDTITIDVYDPSASSGHHKITLFEPSGASVTQAADEKDRSILIEGTIDGSGAFVFDGSTVRYRHGSFREPDDIKINGKPWTDLSEPFELGFTPSAETLSNIKVAGRGIAAMRMADGNLEVLIDDVAGGAGPYRIILSGREDKP
jgi:tetratricopeptide (TPR) repeat protein